jgi:hypothetical protein
MNIWSKFTKPIKYKDVIPSYYYNIKLSSYEQGYKNIKELAEDINMNYSTLINKLRGRRPFSLLEAKLISDKLGKNIDELFFQ